MKCFVDYCGADTVGLCRSDLDQPANVHYMLCEHHFNDREITESYIELQHIPDDDDLL